MPKTTETEIRELILGLSQLVNHSKIMVRVVTKGANSQTHSGRLAKVGTFEIGIRETEDSTATTIIQITEIAEMECAGRVVGVPLDPE